MRKNHGEQADISRLRAKPELKNRIDAQGRRYDWLAARLGISKSFLSKVIAGTTLPEPEARVLAALIDADVDGLFELPAGS